MKFYTARPGKKKKKENNKSDYERAHRVHTRRGSVSVITKTNLTVNILTGGSLIRNFVRSLRDADNDDDSFVVAYVRYFLH